MSTGSTPSSGWRTEPSNPDVARGDTLKRTLTTLEAFVAICAVCGGLGLISGELAMPTEWLGATFDSYWIPGLILVIIVGGTMAAAGRVVWTDRRYARDASLGAGLILLVWIFFQVVIIGYQNWLQPTFFLLGVVIVVLSRQLPYPASRSGPNGPPT